LPEFPDLPEVAVPLAEAFPVLPESALPEVAVVLFPEVEVALPELPPVVVPFAVELPLLPEAAFAHCWEEAFPVLPELALLLLWPWWWLQYPPAWAGPARPAARRSAPPATATWARRRLMFDCICSSFRDCRSSPLPIWREASRF
jgi:hypothetical protein